MTETPEPPRPRMVVALIVAFAFFMENLDSTIITTSIPAIAASLDVPPLQLNLAITSYLLSLAVFMPVSGWIADRFGARTVFCSAIALFTLGSALSGAATSLPMLIATRVLQGIGGAMMTPVGRLILLRSFPRDRLITAMMYMSMPAMIGPTLGPLLGGFLTTYAHWRWIFYVNIPIGLLGIFLASRLIQNVKVPPPARFDFLGFVICGAGLALLQLAVETLAHPIGPRGVETALFVGAVATLSLYSWYAHRHDNPAVDLTVFRVRGFRIGVASGTLCRIGLNAAPFLLPLMLQLGFGLNALEAGSLTFIATVGAIVMRPAAKFLLRNLGFRWLMVGNAVLSGFSVSGFALFEPETSHVWVLLYVFAYGVLRSTQFIAINTLIYADMPPSLTSRATSVGSIAQQLSISFGVAISATLLSLIVGPEQHFAVRDFHIVFGIAGLFCFVSALGFLRLHPLDGVEVSGYRPRGS